MIDPLISQARSDFQATKGDLRSAFESGDLTQQQFREAKDQARDIFGGFKDDVRGGTVSNYSNPFASFSYTPTAGITTLDTGTTGLPAGDATGIATGTVTQPAPFVPSYGDLYAGLSANQENKLNRLADLYAAGELEGREGKINKLSKLLGKADLGTLESYFSQEPGEYTAPTDLGVTLPSNVTYQQLADIFRSDDPLRSYAAAQRYGLTPEQILNIRGGYQTSYYNPVQTRTGIENLLYQGQSVVNDIGLARQYATNPNAQIFIDNPNLVNRAQQTIYAYQNPITEPLTSTVTNRAGESIAGSGQYGYLNNAPILNADIVDRLFGDSNRASSSALQRNQDILDELGWNFSSNHDLNMGVRGVRVVGLNENTYTPAALELMDKGETITTEDGVNLLEYGPERQALVTAAEKLGIDPDKYETSASLYQAVENATSNLYAFTGGYKNQWDPTEISEIGDKGNHATVIYREINGMLVPISEPNLFKYEKPDDPIIGGAVGEILGGIPFLPQIGFIISGGNPAVSTALAALQTASRSGDIEDVLTNTGLAWLTNHYIPQTLGPYIQTEIATMPAISQLAQTNPELANFIVKGGSNAAISGGMALLSGRDPTDAALSSLVQSGVLTITNKGIDMTGIPDQYKSIVSRIIADTILGNDPKNSLTGIASAFIKDEFKDVGKKTGKTNEARSIETGM